jgi:hypothetical protein
VHCIKSIFSRTFDEFVPFDGLSKSAVMRGSAMQDLRKAFELLDIAPSDDEQAVRRAWRALVRSYHPDMAKDDPEGANRRLAEINAAFDAVSSCTKEDVRKLKAQAAQDARAKAGHAAQAARMAAKEHAGLQSRALVVMDNVTDDQEYTRQERMTATSGAPWHLARAAAEAFETARRICAKERHQARPSVFL